MVDRRQAVRHWVLVPAFAGSNPAGSAIGIKKTTCGLILCQKLRRQDENPKGSSFQGNERNRKIYFSVSERGRKVSFCEAKAISCHPSHFLCRRPLLAREINHSPRQSRQNFWRDYLWRSKIISRLDLSSKLHRPLTLRVILPNISPIFNFI